MADSRGDDVQTRHAALLADPRIQNGAGDGQRIRLLQALQRTHGNAYVTRVIAQLKAAETAKRNGNGMPAPALAVQLQAATACPAPPKEPVATPPQEDPNFRAVGGEVKKGATTLKRHEPAKKKATEAQDAAKAPPDDIESQAKAAKTDKMSTAKPGTFDKAAFIAAVRTAIAAKAPKNLDEADKFAKSGNASVKAEVTGQVTQGKEGAAKDVKQKAQEPPDPSKAKPKEVKPPVEEKPGSRPPDPAGAKAMPTPAPPAEKNLDAGKCETDAQMAEAEITEEQLAKSNEPEFQGALEAKKEGEQHSATAPAEVEQKEKAVLSGAKQGATADAKGAMNAMFAAKKGSADKVGAGKAKTQSKDEAERAKVSREIKGIYDRTEKDVKGILDGLDKKVDEAFSRGEAEAKRAFTQKHESEMKAYKKRRYKGLRGKARWFKDKFAGLPEEANQIYIQARDTVYLPKMDQVISKVADIVGGELTRAKQRIEQGRAEINKYVSGLPANLKKFGAEAQKEFTSKFDELEKSVDDKQSELVDSLATKYVEARNAVDEEIKKMQEENKGLWDKVKDAVVGVIKTILELKDMLLGVLARAASVIGKIIKDPIGFLGNLISGVKGGLQAFISNIAEHLKKGVVGWLLGSMRSAGLELPSKFDIKGILGLIASLLGLTWAAIRGRVVQRGVPEQAMSAVEESAPVAQTLKNEGVAGLWQQITAKIGDIKEMILEKLSKELIPTVFMAGITWIISLLNPASAFIKAVKAIIDIVRFIFQRAAQLAEFINAVLDAIVAIASGAIGGAIKAIENALAKSIPVLIGFLAALLGIGGLADKVKKVFQALSKPVMKVVDKVVDFIVKTGKKLWAKLKGGGRKLKEKAKGAIKKWLRPHTESFAMDGASHRLIAADQPSFKLEMASSPAALSAKLAAALPAIKAAADDIREADPARARQLDLQYKHLSGVVKLASECEQMGVAEVRSSQKKGPSNKLRARIRALVKALDFYGKKYHQKDIETDKSKYLESQEVPIKKDSLLYKKFGMRVMAARHAVGVAGSHGVELYIRPTNPRSIVHLNRGALPKPEAIKAKTINAIDVLIGSHVGIRKQDIGLVGYFQPRMPSDEEIAQAGKTPMEVAARFAQRQKEQVDYHRKMYNKIQKGKIEIREGKVIDVATQKGFTGDYDLFAITKPGGRYLDDDALKRKVVNQLKAAPFSAQHGAHLDWEKKIKGDPVNQRIFDVIVKSHEGGEALLKITGGGCSVAYATPDMRNQKEEG